MYNRLDISLCLGVEIGFLDLDLDLEAYYLADWRGGSQLASSDASVNVKIL
jgi:hypothetical protein